MIIDMLDRSAMKTNNEIDVRLIPCQPGAYIEIDDPMTGKRRLGLVCDSGTEFVDYIDNNDPPTPFPILDAFDPKQWGECSNIAVDFILKGDMDSHAAYSDLLVALCDTPAVADRLTLNRAAKWAYETGIYDAGQAAKAGIAATIEARARQAVVSAKAAEWIATGAV